MVEQTAAARNRSSSMEQVESGDGGGRRRVSMSFYDNHSDDDNRSQHSYHSSDDAGQIDLPHSPGPLDMTSFDVSAKDSSPQLLHRRSTRNSSSESSDAVVVGGGGAGAGGGINKDDNDGEKDRRRQSSAVHDHGTEDEEVGDQYNNSVHDESLRRSIREIRLRRRGVLHDKLLEKVPRVMVMEINQGNRGGGGGVKEFTLRELYRYIVDSFPAAEAKPTLFSRTGTSSSNHMNGPSSYSYVTVNAPPPVPSVYGMPSSNGVGGGVLGSPSSGISNSMRFSQRKTYAAGGQENNVLRMRDIRNLVASSSTSAPYIFVRRHVILLSFETLRCIVLYHRMLIILDEGCDGILEEVSRTLRELERGDYGDSEHGDGDLTIMKRDTSRQSIVEPAALAFELCAVEAVLSACTKSLHREISAAVPKVRKIITQMEGPGNAATSASHNDNFRFWRNVIGLLETRANAHKQAIWQFMEDDEDMVFMSLTRLMENPQHFEYPLAPEVVENDEVELLLEAHMTQISSLANQLHIIKERMNNTEGQVMVKLDIVRNRILTIDLLFSMITLCVGGGTFVSGIFGMNLHNPWFDSVDEEHFMAVTIGTSAAVLVLSVMIFVFLKYSGLLIG